MARAETRTWLPLDRWAEIVGINPLHFNQLASTQFPDLCGEPWYQYAWQDADRVGRESIAQAIREAELMMSRYLGYNLVPDWTNEILLTERPSPPELYGHGYNPRYARKSVSATKGHVISGGVRASTLIEAGVAIVRSDVDGDTYSELCTVTVTTDVTDCEIKVFHPGHSGSIDYEIRPVSISSSGGIATITFKSWQAVKQELTEKLNPEPLTDSDDTNYITTVDIYRVYNDPQTQVLFMWEALPNSCDCGNSTCIACGWGTQNGCLQVRDNRLGFLTYNPATWDVDDEEFDNTEWSIGREPEKTRVYYYSGKEDQTRTCPRTEMDTALEKAVAYLASTLVDRDMCACSNVQNFLEFWREDLARQGTDVAYQNTPMLLGNPFGTMRGAYYAYQVCNQEGRKIGR